MLKKVNLLETAKNNAALYDYSKVAGLNGHTVSVVNVENRTLPFHVHEDSDEMFFVIEGSFQLETNDGLTDVNAGEIIVVPKGTRHRPVVKELCRCMLIELDGTLNTSNS